jgi:type IV secretory pathway VirB9-like protein
MTYFVRRNAEKLPSIFLAVCKQEETNKGSYVESRASPSMAFLLGP